MSARQLQLIGHPDNPAGFCQQVSATLARLADGGLALSYAISGAVDVLHLPTSAGPAPADALWSTTCTELFIGPADGPGYREFNFSPSGQWAAYDFRDYREHSATRPDLPVPAITLRHSGATLCMEVRLTAAALPDSAQSRLGLSAVLASRDGQLGYWALHHAPGKPDFHHASAFALLLE